jgi:hypothetical protein
MAIVIGRTHAGRTHAGRGRGLLSLPGRLLSALRRLVSRRRTTRRI